MNSVYHRDFDAELEDEARAAARALAAVYTPDDLSAAAESAARIAHERGLAEGHAAGEAEALGRIEARRAAALEALVPRLDRMLADRLAHRAALEGQLLDFALSVCERVFPEFIAQRSAAAAAEEIRRLIGLALGRPRLRIRLSPATRDLMAPELQALTAERLGAQQTEIVADPSLAPGNAHVSWEDGFAEYSYADVCDAILDALKDAAALLAPTSGASPANASASASETSSTKKAT